ncbi:MAG: hypothetical protein QOI76_4161 [Frankiales bacterium]|jgi:hypothetical protein|nr:hypothetical protein [Frankiales bacterium]
MEMTGDDLCLAHSADQAQPAVHGKKATPVRGRRSADGTPMRRSRGRSVLFTAAWTLGVAGPLWILAALFLDDSVADIIAYAATAGVVASALARSPSSGRRRRHR